MKKLLLAVAVMTGSLATMAQQAFTLQEAIDYAAQHDRTLRNAQLNIQDAEGQIKEIRAIGLPKLNGKIDYQHFIDLPTQILPDFISPAIYGVLIQEGVIAPRTIEMGPGQPVQFGLRNTLNAGVEASMLVFDGTYLVGLQASRLYKDLVQLQTKQTERELQNRVTDAYISTLVFAETKRTIEQNIANLESLLTETQATVAAGFGEQLDLDRLNFSLQSLRTQLATLSRQEEQVKNLLKFAMSYPLDQDLTVADDINTLLANDFSLTADATLALNDRPEVAVVDKSLELSDMDIKQYKMGYYPSVAAFGSYQYSWQGDNLFDDPASFPVTVVGAQVNVPIFDGFEKRSKIQRAQVAKEKAINQRQDLVRAIELEVATAKIAYQNAFEQVENAKRSEALAQKIYNTTKTKYQAGIGSSFELLQAEQDLYRAQGEYQQALFGYLQAKADLKQALGK